MNEFIDHMKIVIKQIKNDKELYYGWQANIAMQFKDELHRCGYKLPDEHEIANQAAKNFLDLLLKD